jgi:hypothetical protein
VALERCLRLDVREPHVGRGLLNVPPMDSVRDLLDGAGATVDDSATWTAPERRGGVERDAVVSFGDWARAAISVVEVHEVVL